MMTSMWSAVGAVEGFVTLVIFVAIIFNRQLGEKIGLWVLLEPRWLLVPIAVIFAHRFLRAIYENYSQLEKGYATRVRNLESERDVAREEISRQLRLRETEKNDHGEQLEEIERTNGELSEKLTKNSIAPDRLTRVLRSINEKVEDAPRGALFSLEAASGWVDAVNVVLRGSLTYEARNRFKAGDFNRMNVHSFGTTVASLRSLSNNLKLEDLLD